jgi:hypothetical protein
MSRLVFAVAGLTVYVSPEFVRGLEDNDPALLDGHLDPCFGISANALALAAHHEIAEARELHGFTCGQAVANFS